MEHKTKHEDHQKREDEVANLWRTWMSANHTKNGLNGRTTLIWEKNRGLASSLSEMAGSGSGRKKASFYSGQISTG